MGHIHAATMAEYAEDAKKYNKPWEMWQLGDGFTWCDCTTHPCWAIAHVYRRKPRTLAYTITIPEPLWEAPGVEEVYYVAAPEREYLCREHVWAGRGTEVRWLKRGLCFATKEDAITAAKAMIAFKQEEA